MTRVLTASATALLSMQPPPLRSQPVFQAMAAATADQLDKLNAAIDDLFGLVIPKTSGDWLYLWETMVGVTANPSATLDERFDVVETFLARMLSNGYGSDWVALATELIGSGWSYDTATTSNHVIVNLGTAQAGLSLDIAYRLFVSITPANTVVDLNNPSGMLLDVGLLDVHELG